MMTTLACFLSFFVGYVCGAQATLRAVDKLSEQWRKNHPHDLG